MKTYVCRVRTYLAGGRGDRPPYLLTKALSLSKRARHKNNTRASRRRQNNALQTDLVVVVKLCFFSSFSLKQRTLLGSRRSRRAPDALRGPSRLASECRAGWSRATSVCCASSTLSTSSLSRGSSASSPLPTNGHASSAATCPRRGTRATGTHLQPDRSKRNFLPRGRPTRRRRIPRAYSP